QRARGDRAPPDRGSAEALERSGAHRILDARRARRGMGALERVARAARAAIAGLVPPRRGERNPAARRVLAASAPLRLRSYGEGSRERPPPQQAVGLALDDGVAFAHPLLQSRP